MMKKKKRRKGKKKGSKRRWEKAKEIRKETSRVFEVWYHPIFKDPWHKKVL